MPYEAGLRPASRTTVRLATLCISGAIGFTWFAGQPVGASGLPASLIVRNAVVYTVDPSEPWAQAVVIRDHRILAVGSNETAMQWAGEETRIIDAGGRLVLPAFGDAHIHPVMGGLGLAQCSMHEGKSIEEYLQIVRDCIASSSGNGVLYGGGWRPGLFPPDGVPTKYALDEIAPDRALVFRSIGGHSLWVNSKALEMAGITRATPDPPNGRIDRDPATGEPNGGLQEAARDLVMDHVPAPSVADMAAAILRSVNHMNELGVTYWLDAGIGVERDGSSRMLEAYAAVQDSGSLRMHVALSLKWDNERGADQLPVLVATAERAEALGFSAHTVKMYLDGVIAQRTAAMLEPYSDSAEERGEMQIPTDVLSAAVVELDRRGFQVYVHAIGDRATRTALDAFEVALAQNGERDNRHMITHLNVINPQDQPRFGQLGVTANLQPLWAELDPYMQMTAVRIGPQRMQQIYPAASLLKAGSRLAYGADWPVDSANPFDGIEVAMTRLSPAATDGEALLANEGVTLEQALRAYTQNVAIVARLEQVTGSLTPGKSADLIVVDQNIFTVPVHEISNTKVVLTLFQGAVVHEAGPAL